MKRQRPDKFTNSGAYGNADLDAIHHALKPLDLIASKMEMKWGYDRLPSLVDPDTAAKFGSAKAKLDAAIETGVVADVVKRSKIMIKGWQALNGEAVKNAATEVSSLIWTHRTEDGLKVAVARSYADIKAGLEVMPELKSYPTYTLDEIARLVSADRMNLVNSLKKEMPTCQIIKVQEKYTDLDGEIPF